MSDRDLPSVDYLRQRLRYDAATGTLYWNAHPALPKKWNGRYAGREAFTAVRNTGYKHGRVDGQAYQAHRVVWAMHHGVWPEGLIDHINQDKTDNRIENLRVVDARENQRNQRIRRNNTSGVMGVSFFHQTQRWSAYITVNRRKHHLGYFGTMQEAVAARKAAEAEYGFHRNHGVEAPKHCEAS